MKKGNKTTFFTVLGIIIVAILLLVYGAFFSNAPTETVGGVPCIGINEDYHIHPHLRITANGQNVPIPTNIGIRLFGCTRVLHTHDETGTIHVEDDHYAPYTLGQFFAVWQKPLSRDQLLEYTRDENHEIIMTVDGKEYTDDPTQLLLADKQEIVLEYREVKR